MTRIVRLRRSQGKIVSPPDGVFVYIGRKMTMGGWNLAASVWQNPYPVKDCGSVGAACAKFEAMIRKDAALLNRIDELRGKTLGCWCDIRRDRCSTCGAAGCSQHYQCHGEVLLKLLEERRQTAATPKPPAAADQKLAAAKPPAAADRKLVAAKPPAAVAQKPPAAVAQKPRQKKDVPGKKESIVGMCKVKLAS